MYIIIWLDKYFRSDCEYIKDVIKPFDWTYTTDYKGTVFGTDGNQLKVIFKLINARDQTKNHLKWNRNKIMFGTCMSKFGIFIYKKRIMNRNATLYLNTG